MGVFTKEIKFVSNQLGEDEQFSLVEVTKTATFKELSRTDKDQHMLPFMMAALFEVSGKNTAKISDQQLYDLTVKCIDTLLIEDEIFTSQDKTEFMNDSFAIFKFGWWLMGEKITPFFQNLMAS